MRSVVSQTASQQPAKSRCDTLARVSGYDTYLSRCHSPCKSINGYPTFGCNGLCYVFVLVKNCAICANSQRPIASCRLRAARGAAARKGPSPRRPTADVRRATSGLAPAACPRPWAVRGSDWLCPMTIMAGSGGAKVKMAPYSTEGWTPKGSSVTADQQAAAASRQRSSSRSHPRIGPGAELSG
jgi:hypothetical protein